MIKEIEDSFIRLRDEADETTCAKGERELGENYIDNVKQYNIKNGERKSQTKITTQGAKKKLKTSILSK